MCKKAACDSCSEFSPPLSNLLAPEIDSSTPSVPPVHDCVNPNSLIHTKLSRLLTGFLEKSTWWGCGSHVPMVMDSIPEEERCACDPKIERDGKQYPPMAKQPF
ncbi:hypothetical protein MY8738_004619 [Beauveria namnaoensis]